MKTTARKNFRLPVGLRNHESFRKNLAEAEVLVDACLKRNHALFMGNPSEAEVLAEAFLKANFLT